MRQQQEQHLSCLRSMTKSHHTSSPQYHQEKQLHLASIRTTYNILSDPFETKASMADTAQYSAVPAEPIKLETLKTEDTTETITGNVHLPPPISRRAAFPITAGAIAIIWAGFAAIILTVTSDALVLLVPIVVGTTVRSHSLTCIQ